MSNTIYSHLYNEKDMSIKINEEQESIAGTKYRGVLLGMDITLFMTIEQLEELFLELDTKLHDKTETIEYMEERIEILENMVADMEEEHEEIAGLPCNEHDGEHDFYEAM